MKRNLSSKAIKAMAIGMAVTLGSTAAISGVIGGNGVVTVKATSKIDDTTAPSITNGNFDTELSNNNYVITTSGLLFKVTDRGTTGNNGTQFNGTEGKATLVKRASVPTEAADGTESKPFGASLENGVLMVKADNATDSTGKVYKLKVTELGDGTNPIDTDLSNVNVSALISKNLEKINTKAFSGTTISEDLDINTDNITSSSLTLGDELLKGATINGNLTIGGSKTATPALAQNIFKDLTVNGNLDLSKLNVTLLTNLSSLGLGARDDEGVKGVTVTGELLLPTTITVDNSSLKNINVGTLDLSKVTTMNMKNELPQGLLQNSTVGKLVLPKNITTPVENTFAGATLTDFDFSNIKLVKWYSFIGSTINSNLDLSNKQVNKHSLTDATINGSLDLSNAILEKSDKSVLSGATITGDLNLSNDTIPATTNDTGVLSGVTVNGNVILTGIAEISDNTFKNSILSNITLSDAKTIGTNAFSKATLPNSIELPKVTTIRANAFDLANVEKVTISLPSYTNANLDSINADAFGSTATIELVLPFGTSNADAEALQNRITNKNVTVTVEQATVNGYVFEQGTKDGEVTLVDYAASAKAKQGTENTFVDGILTYNNQKYTLTKVGNGTSLTNITDEALNGHTSNVIEVAANAFDGNQNITKADFPNATKIGAKAFANTKIKTADLGSKATGAITVASDAFSGVSTLKSINTNSQSKEAVKTAVSNSSSTNITLNAGGSTEVVKPDNNGGSSSGGGSSSSNGNKFTGSGANIGNTSNNITENNSSNSNNNNNNTSEVIENKTLTLASIKLPSVTGEAKVFSDVSANHWAKSYIDKLSTAGVINGSNGMFNPNGQTKRADATIMLVNLLGLQPESNSRFADVASTAYYAPYVGTASTYGIVNGSNGMFNPESTISRQDTMVMMAQILKALDLNVNADTSVLNQFSDVNSVSSYATESVAILVNSGIISGNNGKLNPTSPVTRAEMATIMSKLYDVLESATK